MKKKESIQNISEWQMILKVEELLLTVLKNVPVLSDIKVQRNASHAYDIEIMAMMEGVGEVSIACEVKGNGEPQHVRRAISQLEKWKQIKGEQNNTENMYCMVAAPYISSDSVKLCEEKGIGYIDLSGNCLLHWKNIYVRIEGNPNKYKDSRGGKAIFERSAVKSSIVLRVLMHNYRKSWRVQELANASSASLGQIAKIMRFMEEREFIRKDEAGFALQKLKDLIMEWGNVYNSKANTVHDYYTLDSVPQIEQRLAEMKEKIGVEYALTAHAAAVRYSPAVRYNKVHAYISMRDLNIAAEYLDCKPVTSGSNLSFIEPYDPCVLFGKREIGGIDIVSPVQASLDLLGLKGRGEEAALAIFAKEFGEF